MLEPTELVFPIEKAIYLFSRDSIPGQGGDKQKFWREVLGFTSPELIRVCIMDRVSIADLVFQRQDQYGARYQAVILIEGPSGVTWQVRTGWMMPKGERTVRFITAFPVQSWR